MDSLVKTFVVNLEDYKENFDEQKPYLEHVGIVPERFSAINALKNEHLHYKDFIAKYALYFTPKSTIGCGLSHVLLAHHINNIYIKSGKCNDKYFLIMEDDAFPVEKYNNKIDFLTTCNTTINEIEILDPNWDIIQLHSDALFPTHSTYHTHFFCGSTAAYLISRKGIDKMTNEKVTNHVDFFTQNFIKYNKYRSRYNLFYTDEQQSLNRKKNNYYSVNIKKSILQKMIPLRGEKDWGHFLNFKIIRLPLLNHDLTGNEILDYLAVILLIKFSLKHIKK